MWIYGSKRDKKPPVVMNQNPHLRQLDAVVSNSDALDALRGGATLDYSFELSRLPSNVLVESLRVSERTLQTAHSMLSTGYDNSEHLLDQAERIAELAANIHEELMQKTRLYSS